MLTKFLSLFPMFLATVYESMFSVFDAIGDWITGAIADLQAVFYNSETGLTFMGTLAVIGLGIGLIFLIIGVIQNFIRLRS